MLLCVASFIDKSNLNGETTLEVMNSMVQTKALCANEKDIEKLALTLTYEAPNKRFDSFRGHIQMKCGDNSEFSVDGKSLIMRETNLRNCDYIYGLVVYTGNDTKIQRSNLEGEKPKVCPCARESRQGEAVSSLGLFVCS